MCILSVSLLLERLPTGKSANELLSEPLSFLPQEAFSLCVREAGSRTGCRPFACMGSDSRSAASARRVFRSAARCLPVSVAFSEMPQAPVCGSERTDGRFAAVCMSSVLPEVPQGTCMEGAGSVLSAKRKTHLKMRGPGAGMRHRGSGRSPRRDGKFGERRMPVPRTLTYNTA